jgi:replicative DNA helicase
MNPIQLRSEHLVLYTLITRPETVHDIMSSISADMFLDEKNKIIFEAAVDLYVEHKPIDTLSVYKAMLQNKSTHKAEAQLEVTQLVGKFNIVPAYEFQDAMIYLIAESVRNEHQGLGIKIAEMSRADNYDPEVVLNFLQEHITNNKFKSLRKDKEQTNETLLEELDASMKKSRDSEGISGIKTGFTEFDKCTSGMQPTNLIIVAARPAMGKTQWALGAMKNASITEKHKGIFFSCEMAAVQVMKRVIAIEGQIKGYSIKYGKLSRDETIAYYEAGRRITDSNLKILAGSWNINDIVAECHKAKNSTGLDYVVVDYIQKVHGSNKNNRNNEVEEVTGKLKDLANELEIPVIALAQLSRAVEQRPDKRPMLSDLRDSGAIEQDADIVLFLYRPSYYMEEAEKQVNPMAKDAYIMIAKHRDGDLRDILMKFEEDIPAWRNQRDPEIKPLIQEVIDFDDEEAPSAIQPNTDFEVNNNDLPF